MVKDGEHQLDGSCTKCSFFMKNLHNMLEAGLQKSLHISYTHDLTGIIAQYDNVMNVTTNSPLFILFTILCTPPI